jgi:4-amino-4-deoxy-L-arabinose transferase-like glycosyltransferase
VVSDNSVAAPAAGAAQGAPARVRRALPALVLLVVLVGALAIRIDFIWHAYYFKDDHGTAALMSLHILEGRETPVYFYGWFYVAALGAYVGAAMFALFGVSPESLCLAMTLFTLLWVFATYLLFSRLVGRWGGVVAASLVAFAPFTVMWYSVVPLLGYPPTFALGTLMIYLGVRLNERPLSSRAEWWCLLGLGAVAGIAIWVNPLCAAYLVVAFGLLVAHIARSGLKRALLGKLTVALALFAITLVPVIVTAFEHGLRALFGFRGPRGEVVQRNIELVRTYYLGDMLFKGSPAHGAVRGVVAAAYVAAAAGFLAAFIVGIVAAVRKKKEQLLRATLVPLAFVLIYAALFLPSPMTATRGPRYFVPFYLGVSAIFALPFALRRWWFRLAGACCALVVIAHNAVVNLSNPNGDAGRRRMADMRALVDEVKAAGLRHVMIDSLEGQTLTFVAREAVIFADAYGERYYPYGVSAAVDDRTAISTSGGAADAFREALTSLDVTAPPPIMGAGIVVFHDFVLPADALRLVEPRAVFVAGGRITGDAAWLSDRDDDTFVSARYDEHAAFVVDFGRDVSLRAVRFVAPEERDYPVGYVLSGLRDGADWREDAQWVEVQRVVCRLAPACIVGDRLYHRGTAAAMECRFAPTSLRYLKIHDLRSPAERVATWRVQEAYFYESEPDAGRPDEREAADVAHELAARGVELAICDEWLSRKLETVGRGAPSVLPHYEVRKPASRVSRIVPIRSGVAVVVEPGHAAQCRSLLTETTLDEAKIGTVEFPHYTALVIEAAPDAYRSFPGVKWNGFTLVGTDPIVTAAWYQKRGECLDRADKHERAMAHFARAFQMFPGLPDNLHTLAKHDEKARSALEALSPEVPARCAFPGGISLVGYTVSPSPLVAGRIATLRLVWGLEGRVPYNYVPVFVHFLDAEGIAFQADHNAVFAIAPGSTVPRCLVLDEHEFAVPSECPPGRLTIRLGALQWGRQSRRLKPRTELPSHRRAVEIGDVLVVQPASN